MQAEALKIGFTKLHNTRDAAQRVHVHLSGQDPKWELELEHEPFAHMWEP